MADNSEITRKKLQLLLDDDKRKLR